MAGSEWVTVLSGVMMAAAQDRQLFGINPLADPPLSLDLILIEPARRQLSAAAAAFPGAA